MGLQKVLGPISVLGLFLSEVVLIFTCYCLAVLALADVDLFVFLLYNWGAVRIGILVAVILLGLHFQDLYDRIQVPSVVGLYQQLCLAIGLAFLVQALLYYADSRLTFPRWVMLTGSTLVLLLIPAWRVLYSWSLRISGATQKILFLGLNTLAEELTLYFRETPELGISVLGFVADKRPNASLPPVLGAPSALKDIVQEENPDLIVVAQEEAERQPYEPDLLYLHYNDERVEDIAQLYENTLRRVCVSRLRPPTLIFSESLSSRPHFTLLQDIYSKLFAAIGLLLTVPITLPVALAIKFTSKGPILYRQRRTGLRGRPFMMLKFRSMYADAEMRTGAVWAQQDDPRITRLGRWLRRFRIDEIPQLVNVLRGEMSIVGPRPERPEFVDTLAEKIPFYRQRLVVKPGITGWAQVSYRYTDSLEDTITKLEYDLFYVKSLSPLLDLYVMFHTVKVVLLGRGAQ